MLSIKVGDSTIFFYKYMSMFLYYPVSAIQFLATIEFARYISQLILSEQRCFVIWMNYVRYLMPIDLFFLLFGYI